MTFLPERRPRVVIADDHPSVLVAFARMLQPCCDVVATVATGQEAIDAVERLKPDILLVDLMLPDVDGLVVCRTLKVTAPETDVVIVTAFDDAQVEATASMRARPRLCRSTRPQPRWSDTIAADLCGATA